MLAKRVVSVLGSSLPSVGQLRWLVCLLLLLATAGSTAAQQYRSDPVDEKVRRYSANAKQWLGNPGAYTADKAHFDEYFEKFYFPDMTRTDDVALGRLGESRFNLFKKFLWNTTDQNLQRDLTAAAYKKMREIAISKEQPPYHPAVRYNAVLVLGLLDEQYAAGAQKPKPLLDANKFLTQIVSLAADDKPVPPPLVLGALIGLERHLQLRESLPPDAVTAMTAAMLKLVSHEQPIQEMDPDAYAWIRLRAAEALAKMGGVGDKNSIHNAIVKLVASSKSLDDRCEAAGMLDKVNYKDVKLDDATTAEPLFALARDVATAEDKRAADFQSQFSGGVSVGPSAARSRMSEFSPGSGTGEQTETYPRRQVLTRLTNLRAAVAKVKPSLPTDTQKKADELLKAIDPAKTAISDKGKVELTLAAAIRTMAININKAVPAATVEKAPPAKAAAAL